VTQGSVDYTLEDIELKLSTTSTDIDSMSLAFDENIGTDEMSVFRGALRVVYDGSYAAAAEFAVVLELQRHFLYDPSMGNLLMQIQLYSEHPNYDPETNMYSPFFFQSTSNDDATQMLLGTTFDSEMGIMANYGFVTQFTTSTIPVPASLWLFASALAGMGWLRRKQAA
jgi:hypothetical protein